MAAIKTHFQKFPPSNSEIEVAATGSAEPKQLFGCGNSSASSRQRKRPRVGRPAMQVHLYLVSEYLNPGFAITMLMWYEL